MTDISRREFLAASAVAAATAGLDPKQTYATDPPAVPGGGPVVIASANGLNATARAAQLLQQGLDPLDAVVAGVNLVEEDPLDHSVGYGGLPNEDGVVELDASVMHGPTHKAGAVAALRNIKTPSKVALQVMRRTDHVLIVGEGALRFARAHGFEEVNLLTDEAREIWLRWKELRSDEDDWLPPEGVEAEEDEHANALSKVLFTHGTINCCALDAKGDLAGVTTTSGLSYKLPGRVGDSPLIGAGLYVDNEVGAAGSTGRGETVIRTGGARTVIEGMRRGLAPTDACLEALRYIVQRTSDPRLLRADGRPKFNVSFYALAKDGRFGAAAIWSHGQFAVHAAGQNRIEESAYLWKRPPDMMKLLTPYTRKTPPGGSSR